MERRALARFALVTLLSAWPAAAFAQVAVLVSGGFRAAFDDASQEFERTSGTKVTTLAGASQGSGPNVIGAQLRRGVAADVVIMSKEGLADLLAEGRIVKGSEVDLGQAPLGVAVRAGAPAPDIRSVEAFKQTLLRAKGITFPGSTTGIYMMKEMFPKLGIADALASKITNTGVSAVASGDAEIAIQPVSELLRAPGVTYVGVIPKEIQYVSVFSAAIVRDAAHPDTAERLMAFLKSEAAASAVRKSGLEPLAGR